MSAGCVSPARSSSEPLADCPMLQLEAEGGEQVIISTLRSMLNNPLLGDLCLLCKDGVKVHACRMLLMARSDVLRQMLSNGMAESCMSEISLPEISSLALLPTLEYLYTGAITQHKMDLGTAFLVVHAASFFNLPTLEARLKPLLCALVPPLSECPAVLAQHLSTLEACGLIHLLDDVVSVVVVCLRRHCCSAQPSGFLRHMSTQAMQVLVGSLKAKNKQSIVFSFMEYISVRSLLIWGASLTSTKAEEFFESALPNEDVLALHFAALKSSGKSFLEVGLGRKKTIAGGLLTAKELVYVKDLQEFLGNIPWILTVIELIQIHPVILISVLKPLNILDLVCTCFEDVFQYQAVHMGEMNLMKWVLRKQSTILKYEVQENGAVLFAKTLSNDEQIRSPYAWTNIAFSKPSGVHEISVIVEEPAAQTRICICCAPAYSRGTADTFKPTGHLTIYHGLIFSLSVQDKQSLSGECKIVKQVTSSTRLKEGDRIKAIVDMRKSQCAFQVKGYTLVLENLLEEVLLTARLSPSGKLRVALASDNTFL